MTLEILIELLKVLQASGDHPTIRYKLEKVVLAEIERAIVPAKELQIPPPVRDT